MPNLLTLAISESKPHSGEYKIVALDIQNMQFYDMDLKLEEISKGNQKLWDIGGVTSVDRLEITYNYNNNLLYHPEGNIKFVKSYSRRELKNVFKKNSIELKKFYQEDITHAIIRIDYLDDILKPFYDNEGVFKSYIKVTAQGYQKRERILNKDLRWLNYWKHIYDKNRLDEKLGYFKKLVNESLNQDAFLIMYRHNFRNGSNEWIEGFHWL